MGLAVAAMTTILTDFQPFAPATVRDVLRNGRDYREAAFVVFEMVTFFTLSSGIRYGFFAFKERYPTAGRLAMPLGAALQPSRGPGEERWGRISSGPAFHTGDQYPRERASRGPRRAACPSSCAPHSEGTTARAR